MHHSERRFTQSDGFFTAYLDLLVFFYSLFRYSFSSSHFVAVAVRKTCLRTAYLLRCINVLSDDTKNDFIRVRRLFKKQTRALSIASHSDYDVDCIA